MSESLQSTVRTRSPVTSDRLHPPFQAWLDRYIGSMSERHLQRYVTKFDLKWNLRFANVFNGVERADAILKSIAGKLLTYQRTDSVQGDPPWIL